MTRKDFELRDEINKISRTTSTQRIQIMKEIMDNMILDKINSLHTKNSCQIFHQIVMSLCY